MKNITLLLTILSALIITGCDKGTEETAPADSIDSAVENVEEAASEAATSVGDAAEDAAEAIGDAAEAVKEATE